MEDRFSIFFSLSSIFSFNLSLSFPTSLTINSISASHVDFFLKSIKRVRTMVVCSATCSSKIMVLNKL
ncbi:MAG: hypothetical protein MRERV_61c002 [Mycoplasmataceae bacterium RV_VA103A]|nr:MAG: hypothetical protein MRERV_61c002 [Mycoplasmataceae bacterium RV_VA103A]